MQILMYKHSFHPRKSHFNAGSMLAQRIWRWANIEPALKEANKTD